MITGIWLLKRRLGFKILEPKEIQSYNKYIFLEKLWHNLVQKRKIATYKNDYLQLVLCKKKLYFTIQNILL